MTDELPLATSDWRDHCAGFREAYAEKLRAKQEEDYCFYCKRWIEIDEVGHQEHDKLSNRRVRDE